MEDNHYQLLDGKAVSAQMKKEMAEEVAQIKAAGGKIPHLAAILVGHDGGSETYVASKVKTCEEIGFKSTLIRYEDDVTEEELLRRVDELNNDPDVDGFIVQLPLPKHISEQKIIEAIDYRKDVDGFHPINVGRMSIGLPCFVSATPAGILELLKRYEIETSGKHCVVLGRSNIVGKPMATLMMQKNYPGNCTVTVCHSRSKNLKEMCLNADIIIVALGVPEFLKADMVKDGAVIVDVGTTRMPSSVTKSGYKLTGDVKFDEVAPKCSYITPVPGGVGPMTIISLMRNTIPNRIRIIVQLVVVAALVTIVSEVLKAFAYDVNKQLSVFVGLIITNCILMGRLEAFALGNGPWESFLDGIGNGLGYAIILIIVGFFRELLGSGTLLGFQVIPQAFYDLGYVNNGLMILPPMALIVIAVIIWVHRAKNKELQEN